MDVKRTVGKRALGLALSLATACWMLPGAALAEGEPVCHSGQTGCAYVEARQEIPCDMECVDEDNDGVIDHKEGCAYDSGAEGVLCDHACEICRTSDSEVVHTSPDGEVKETCESADESAARLNELLGLEPEVKSLLDRFGQEELAEDGTYARYKALKDHAAACNLCKAQTAEGGAFYSRFHGEEEAGYPACVSLEKSGAFLDALLETDKALGEAAANRGDMTDEEFSALEKKDNDMWAHADACGFCKEQLAEGGAYYEKFYGISTLASEPEEVTFGLEYKNGKLYKSEQDNQEYTSDKITIGNGTVTLNGFQFKTSSTPALMLPAGINLTLNGQNLLESTNNNGLALYISSVNASGSSVEISGQGSLEAVAKTGGIWFDSPVSIKGGDIKAKATDDGSVGIAITDKVVISGGSVTAEGDLGINVESDDEGIGLDVQGGTVNAKGTENDGIFSANRDISISGGTVTATSAAAENGQHYGILLNDGNLNISGGTVTASGPMMGIMAGIPSENESASGRNHITITGGVVKATGDMGGIGATGNISFAGGETIEAAATNTAGMAVMTLKNITAREDAVIKIGTNYDADGEIKSITANGSTGQTIVKKGSEQPAARARITFGAVPAPVLPPPSPLPSGGGSHQDGAPAKPPMLSGMTGEMNYGDIPLNTRLGGSGNTMSAPGGAVNAVTAAKAAADAVEDAVGRAAATGAESASARATIPNAGTLAPDVLQAMSEAAAQAAKGVDVSLLLNADTVDQNGAVLGRMTFDAAQALKTGAPVATGIDVDPASRVNKAAKNRFEKHFGNSLSVVTFDQKGAFGMDVSVALKTDLSGMDRGNLRFYSYDFDTNSYVRIETAYTVDKNGYLHLQVPAGNTLIISDGDLQTM